MGIEQRAESEGKAIWLSQQRQLERPNRTRKTWGHGIKTRFSTIKLPEGASGPCPRKTDARRGYVPALPELSPKVLAIANLLRLPSQGGSNDET